MAVQSGSKKKAAAKNKATSKKTATKKTASKKKAGSRKGGRPSDYTPELGSEICRRIAHGESLKGICQDEDMPARSTVARWIVDDAGGEFSDKYARAKEAQAELLAEDILEIADDGEGDRYIDNNGNDRIDQEAVQRSRLRVDARKWVLARMAPKRWGDKQQVEHSGGINVNLGFDLSAGDE